MKNKEKGDFMDILKILGWKKEPEKSMKEFDYKKTNVCIICGSKADPKKSAPIQEDFIIKAIKIFKKKTGTLRNNKLYVCKKCWEQYKKERKKFIDNVFLWTVLCSILFIVLLAAPLLIGASYNLISVIYMIIIIVVLWIMAMIIQLYNYRPGTKYSLDAKVK